MRQYFVFFNVPRFLERFANRGNIHRSTSRALEQLPMRLMRMTILAIRIFSFRDRWKLGKRDHGLHSLNVICYVKDHCLVRVYLIRKAH